jgi:flagellar biosynthesis component FlhA
MEEGTGFKLIMGFAIMAIALILWLPLNNTISDVATIFNAVNTTNETYNTQMIEHNNNAAAIFSIFPVFLLFVWGLYVVRSGLDERRGGSQ